jgi:hypothetical protein
MIDLSSARTPLTVQLPADLVTALQRLAREQQTTLDDLVQEACLDVVEPHLWERCYQEWERSNPTPAPPTTANAAPVVPERPT